jgi:hypothetical protein
MPAFLSIYAKDEYRKKLFSWHFYVMAKTERATPSPPSREERAGERR